MSKIKAILDQHQNLNCNVFHVSSFFCLPPCQSLAVPLLWQSSCHVLTSYIVTKKTNFRLSTCLQLLRTCSCWWWWMDCRNTETSYGLGTLWSKTKPWLMFRLVPCVTRYSQAGETMIFFPLLLPPLLKWDDIILQIFSRCYKASIKLRQLEKVGTTV